MLDKRSRRMLDVLLRLCGEDGAYKILDASELRDGMSPRFRIDNDNIRHILKFLSDAELIDIKHSDETEYCVAILPKGRIFEEAQARKSRDKSISKGMVTLIILGSFIAAVVGAAVAGVILSLFD